MTEELLDGADVVAGLEQACGKRMTQGVTAGGGWGFDSPAVHEIRLMDPALRHRVLPRHAGSSRAQGQG